MPKQHNTPGHSPALTKTHKLSLAGVATLGAAALAFSLVPGSPEASADSVSAAAPAGFSSQQLKVATVGLSDQLADAQAAAAKKKAADQAAAKQAAEAAAKKKAAAEAAAKKKAEDARKAKAAASRSAKRAAVKPVAAKTYANNLDGWIRQSLDIMKKHGIPGTYSGLHRNIIRESSGNPNAINNWDINAINGVPSIGLLQVIKPTFDAYHVAGTAWSQYDPIANITAAANYAADRYGSIDNVNSAY
ncbi:transglycosylase SLT domain-containing protein [Streptomyces albicerus]|uniref:transglycosylase SLT domain-containing protein n=1 Tax=Streptomyces albicerus TaxID=2569859 RepID=UPI00124B10D6|nr:transglycosylase SLT domain-containing protein [Streptomyces albicerus]